MRFPWSVNCYFNFSTSKIKIHLEVVMCARQIWANFKQKPGRKTYKRHHEKFQVHMPKWSAVECKHIKAWIVVNLYRNKMTKKHHFAFQLWVKVEWQICKQINLQLLKKKGSNWWYSEDVDPSKLQHRQAYCLKNKLYYFV